MLRDAIIATLLLGALPFMLTGAAYRSDDLIFRGLGVLLVAIAVMLPLRLPSIFRRHRRVEDPAATPGRAVLPHLATLEQMRHLPAKLRDFDPSYDAELHGKMKAIHEQLAREHR